MTRTLGRWLFQNRGWTPLPIVIAQLCFGEPQNFWLGVALLCMGEAQRLWAVGFIGGRSRTRSANVGALELGGPFGLLRNPLYLGNGTIALAIGAWGGPVWFLAWAVFVIAQYSLIVRWEETVLAETLGAEYQDYLARVPRWLPIGKRPVSTNSKWGAKSAFRSERATLISLAVVSLLVWTV